MRTLVLLAAALAPAAGRAADPPPRCVTKVFSVADLVHACEPAAPGPARAAAGGKAADRVVGLVTGTVRPYSWDAMGGPGKAEYFAVGSALVVNNTPDVIQEVADLLEALRRLNAPAAEPPQVSCEVRLLKVPAGFCGRMGLKAGDPPLTEREARFLLEAAQGCRDVSVMQAPKLVLADGEPATASVVDREHFVTGLDLMVVQGERVLVPKNTPVDVGHTFTVCGKVAADGRSVEVTAKVTHTRVEGKVELVPVTTPIDPVPEGGKKGKPVPFTQYLQAADVRTHAAEGKAVVPSGGTAVLGTWTEPDDGAAEDKAIPFIGRLFRPAPAACEVVVLVTARVERPEAAPMPRPMADPEVRPAGAVRHNEVYKLRHVAAADAADALGKLFGAGGADVTVVAEPVSNTVLVSAPAGLHGGVIKMLGDLDRARSEVLIQALIVEAPANFLDDAGLTADDEKGNVLTLTPRELKVFDAHLRKGKGRGDVDILSRPQIQVAEGQTGTVGVGAEHSVRTGGVVLDGGTVRPARESAGMGIRLEITPKVAGDRVELQVGASAAAVVEGPARVPFTVPAEVTGKEAVTFAMPVDAVKRSATEAAVRATDGQTTVIRGLVDPHATDRREYLIVLTPHVVKPGDRK
jgi:type II secretory pathway component GspD/PulD (secretin)